jgi:hypothetical protein
MKKLIIICFAVLACMLPSLAQIDHDYNANDREPVMRDKILKEQVPAAVLKAANNQFDKNNPQTWSKFPYTLKEYGWVYDVGASNIKLDRYEVTMKNKEGGEFWAVYSAAGELIETREMSVNTIVPQSVMAEFLKSQYKDWKIVGNKEIIKFYHDHNNSSVEEHFRITVEKDNVRRSISFNWQGNN